MSTPEEAGFFLPFHSWEDAVRKQRQADPNCKYCGAAHPENPHLYHVCHQMSASFMEGVRKLAAAFRENPVYMLDDFPSGIRPSESRLYQPQRSYTMETLETATPTNTPVDVTGQKAFIHASRHELIWNRPPIALRLESTKGEHVYLVAGVNILGPSQVRWVDDGSSPITGKEGTKIFIEAQASDVEVIPMEGAEPVGFSRFLTMFQNGELKNVRRIDPSSLDPC